MTKKEQEYLKNLEECFFQLRCSYECSQGEIKDLKVKIEILKEVCQDNFIEIPDLDGPLPF